MIRIYDYKDTFREMWDDYVLRSSSGTYYHLIHWKDVIEKTFGFKSFYLMASDNADEIRGIFPLFLMKDIVGKNYLISNPSANYTGICASDKEAGDSLLNKAKKIALENNVQYLEIRQLGEYMYDLPARHDYVTMYLRLNRDEESVWKTSLSAKTRNQVRKAYKEGLTIELDKNYIDDFYMILATNFRDLGTPVYPRKFFKKLLKEYGDLSNLMVVKYRGTIIGGMLIICYKNIFSDPWASSLRAFNRVCPNNILYWEAIKYACRNGYEYFDFGRSTLNSGTYNFKKQWGAEPVKLHYQYLLTKMQNIPESNQHKKHYQLALRAWRRLPLRAANMIGPKLNRYLVEL